MQILNPNLNINHFFESLARSSSAILMLDFDGTIAPFQTQFREAPLYPGVAERLEILMQMPKLQVVIVSGRVLSDLISVLPFNPLPELWGSHGWERRTTDGTYEILPIDPLTEEGLKKAYEFCLKTHKGRMEIKPRSVAVHWRGQDEKHQREIVETVLPRWEEIAQKERMQIIFFDGGIELRSLGITKGYAIQTILSEKDSNPAVAYLGDDMTDEDAFIALGEKGLKVIVKEELNRPTAADIQLVPPDELIQFLDQWKEAMPK